MEYCSLLQTFAIDKDGQVRSVDEVARGLACECQCPLCGEPVMARQGSIREWHFAHSSGAECAGAAESALHLAAKQVLVESQGMTLPEVRISRSVTLRDGRIGKGDAIRHEAWIDFLRTDVEQQLGALRPDVIADTGHSLLIIEIAVTHFVDEDKLRGLKVAGIPAVEIDLASMHRDVWTWDNLREVVVDGSSRKSWLIFPEDKELVNEALQKAHDDASTQEIASTKHLGSPSKAPRSRYWIDQRMVDVIERPFGISVWSPFDPVLNEHVKIIMHTLGGRWQPKFKNWLVPTEAKSFLHEALHKLSGRPPKEIK